MKPLRSHAGRVLLVGFSGTKLDSSARAALRELAPAGVIFFRRNLDTPAGLAALLGEVRARVPSPGLFALDQEGGRVSRLEPWLGPTPAAAALTSAGPQSAERFGASTALALRTLGINLDFAPVVDLCPPGSPNGIGDRSFGTDPELVATLAGAFLRGLQAGGVAGCLKHFPGLGDTPVDSHVALPTIPRDRRRLEAEDLLPYRRLAPRSAAVMIGHAYYPALETSSAPLPASLSGAVVTGLLRQAIGFTGLAVSDDLEMGAVAPRDLSGSAAVEAIRAGCDLVLYCSDLGRALQARDALVLEAERDPAFAARLAGAADEVERTARRWPAEFPDARAWRLAVEAVRKASTFA
jgi:beta-N-acetylhexosaminidase